MLRGFFYACNLYKRTNFKTYNYLVNSMKIVFERQLLQGVLTKLSKQFQLVIDDTLEGGIKEDKKGRQLISGLITSNDRYSVIENIAKQQTSDKPFRFPFLALQIETLSLNTNSGHAPAPLFRNGQYVRKDNNGYLANILRPIPTVFDCTVVFLTDDFWQAFTFCSRWLQGIEDRSTLNFTLLHLGIPFTIEVELNTSITFPQKDNTLDMVNLYEISAPLRIHGYTANPVDTEELERSTFVEKINVKTEVMPEALSVEGFEALSLLSEENFVEN